MKTLLFTTAPLLFGFILPLQLHAQTTEATEEPAKTVTEPAEASMAVSKRLDALQTQLVQLKEQNEKLASQLSELQDIQSQGTGEIQSDFGKTKVFGYFDMSFYSPRFSSDGEALKTAVPVSNKSSFMIGSVNVYLGNQITERLKFLTELRFMYMPSGRETSTEQYAVLPNGQTVNLGSAYSRTNTSTMDPGSLQNFRLGGVAIERLHVTYSFNDYLSVLAGHFLTPYGIWNVDHGSPVLLLTRAPVLQTQQIIPSAQMGLQFFGKLDLGAGFLLDYVGTLSNGRGPADTFTDYDNNKALGLRWRLNYEMDELSIAIGQYGYLGKYTDKTRAMYIGPGTGQIKVVDTPTDQRMEYALSNDLLIKFYGVRIQSELAIRRVDYKVPPKLDAANFNGYPTQAGQYNAANHLAKAYYGLLAYELPEKLTGRKLRLTPAVYYEHFNLNDAVLSMNEGTVYAAGLNIRPYRNIVFKLEFDHVVFGKIANILPDGTSSPKNGGTMQLSTCQLAVTF